LQRAKHKRKMNEREIRNCHFSKLLYRQQIAEGEAGYSFPLSKKRQQIAICMCPRLLEQHLFFLDRAYVPPLPFKLTLFGFFLELVDKILSVN
jgi:hypothetical protein